MANKRVNGVDLSYEVTGQGEPLVLVHGSWGDHHNWDAVVPDLARSFQVVTYDRRGHSASERPSSQGTKEQDADDLAALVDALNLACRRSDCVANATRATTYHSRSGPRTAPDDAGRLR